MKQQNNLKGLKGRKREMKTEKELVRDEVDHHTGNRALSLTVTNNASESILTLVAKLQKKEQHLPSLHLLNH